MARKKIPYHKLSKTQKNYRDNPASYAKKKASQKKINARPEKKAYRAELGRKNYASDKNGVKRSGKDYDHATGKYISYKTNRSKPEGSRRKGYKQKK